MTKHNLYAEFLLWTLESYKLLQDTTMLIDPKNTQKWHETASAWAEATNKKLDELRAKIAEEPAE